MKTITFIWDIKEKPEYFIVKEIAEFKEGNNFFLYLLVKKGYNTWELAKKFGFFYAGLKDKNALTFQYVCFKKEQGKIIKKSEYNRFYIFKKIGKINKKIRTGFLKGNKFFIYYLNSPFEIKTKKLMINYYDEQRIDKNWEKGMEILMNIKEKKDAKKLSWLERFKIDCFLSFIWNKSLENIIVNNFDKESLVRVKTLNNNYFIFPKRLENNNKNQISNKIPNYLPILGTKIKMKEIPFEMIDFIDNLGINLEELLKKLKIINQKGDYRKTIMEVENIKKTKRYLSFFLKKGGYATMYLKQVIF